jgi:hypothetical protein
MPDTVAVVDPNSNLSRYVFQGERWSASSAQRPGLWPTARPGADSWTWSVVDTTARLEHLETLAAVEVPGSRTQPPLLLAARLAHYAAWSPSGDALCYVVPDGRALSLRIWRPGEPEARSLLSAAPLFTAWLPGTNWLLCHHGTSLSAFETATGEQRVLSNSAAGFRAPAVAHDGSVFAWAEVRDGRVEVRTGTVEPGGSRVVATFDGGTTLGYQPRTAELTLAVARQPESGVFSELVRVLDSGEVLRIVQGPLVAYWWSPDGSRVASLHPSYTGDGRFQVRYHHATGRSLGATEAFVPSADTATMVGFFDQYSASHPSWSPSGRWFGLCGRLLKEGPHPSFSGGTTDRALIWDTRAPGVPHDLGPAQTLSFGRP